MNVNGDEWVKWVALAVAAAIVVWAIWRTGGWSAVRDCAVVAAVLLLAGGVAVLLLVYGLFSL